MNELPLSYSAQIISSSPTLTLETVRRTLSAQFDSLNGSLWGVLSPTLFNELQTLLDTWSDATGGSNQLGISISVEASRISASISTNEKTVASISETISKISVDWEHFDKEQRLRNDGRLELPIKFELEEKRSIGDLSLLCYTTSKATLTGNYVSISQIMKILEESELTPEQFKTVDIRLIQECINPQEVKLDLKNCILIINGFKIPFKENSQQMNVLRAMFGKQGKNHTKLELSLLYDEIVKDQEWDWFDDKSVIGNKKEKFIKQIRNTVDAINNKVRKEIGWTKDFLEVKNNVCRINPQLLI